MKFRITSSILLTAAILAAACTPAPPPVVEPKGDARYLIDPRIGYSRPIPPALDDRLGAAWRFVEAGDFVEAGRRLEDLRVKHPDYAPVLVAQAGVAIQQGNLDRAETLIGSALDRLPRYTAAEVYQAEIAVAEGRPRRAWEIYKTVVGREGVPDISKERAAQLEALVVADLLRQAGSANGPASIALLRDVLTIRPGDQQVRIQLVQKLVAEKSYDEARHEMEPLLNSGEVDRAEVQEALAEIDAGHGRFQEAIVRYERLARREHDPRYARRLDELKQEFAAANMPADYQRALESESLTRADFAVLLYWKVASVRFAQNIGAPPIAIDITDVPGREELIRATALGVFQVDPVTRRADPYRTLNAGSVARLAARVLALRGAPCVRQATPDPSELLRAEKVLVACSVSDPAAGGADLPVTGRAAAELLEQVDRALK